MTKPPLQGIRVADFTWVWAGPYCTLQLAHMGADVIRVESTTRVCVTRLLPPWPNNEMGVNRSGYFNQYNQGKRSITLNFKVPEALEVAKQLIKTSDVVVNNFAAGVMERLGLGYEELRKIKPDIIMASLSGYGATGPYREFVAYGPAQVPLSGFSHLTGYEGGPPMHTGFSYADPNAGIHGAFAILAALRHRNRTGEGQFLDMSQWECAMDLLAEGILDYTMNRREPPRRGNRDPMMAPHNLFRCVDMPEGTVAGAEELRIDQWVAIVAVDDEDWRRICRVIGRPELADDPRFATLSGRKKHEDEVERIISDWTRTRTPQEVTRAMQEAGVPAFTCSSNKDLSEDPHLNQRGYFVWKEHPEVGALQHCGIPWRMTRTPNQVRSAAPLLGQHTDEVLREVLGYSPQAIEALRSAGALA